MAASRLHGACVGEEAGARILVFFRVKWLQPVAHWFLLCVLQRVVVPARESVVADCSGMAA